MDSCQGSHKFTTLYCLRRVNIMHVRILFANPSHNANSVTEFDFLWRANANANFVLLILKMRSEMPFMDELGMVEAFATFPHG